MLIGTKYDKFAALSREEQEEITKQAKRFSKAMHAPLVSLDWIAVTGGIKIGSGQSRWQAVLLRDEVERPACHRCRTPATSVVNKVSAKSPES